jgi:hypothetical protein
MKKERTVELRWGERKANHVYFDDIRSKRTSAEFSKHKEMTFRLSNSLRREGALARDGNTTTISGSDKLHESSRHTHMLNFRIHQRNVS